MSMADFADRESPAYTNLDYNDTQRQSEITKNVHQRMVNEGRIVSIPESVSESIGQYYPDMRGVKKSERTPVLRQKMGELKNALRQLLSGLKGTTYEFEINGNVLDARLYDTGIREVMEKVTQSKAEMLTQSDGIFRNAEYLYSTPDYGSDPNIYRWNYFYTPVNIDGETVGVRIAVRDTVTPAESQIYNWNIKKNAALDGGGHLPYGRPSSGVSSAADGASSAADRPAETTAPVHSRAPLESTIPQTPTGVKSRFTPEGRIYAPRAGEGPVALPTAEEEMSFRLSRNEGGNSNGQQRTEQNYSEQRGTERDYSEQRADAVSRGSEGRGGGERAGGENGVLAESRPRRAADAGRKTLERQAAGRALRLEKISSAELGVENGTNARSISVLPESAYDEELRTVSERIKRQTGLDATFVLGSIQIRTAEGTARVRGIYSRSGIIIQADHTRLSPGQIADHEIFHAVSENDPGLMADVERAITEKYGEEELGRMIDAYIQRLRGVIDIPENASEADIEEAVRAIEEELFADAYAGINSFGQHAEKYSGEARQTMRDRWMIEPGGETEAASARRTGPPERTSIDESYADSIDAWVSEGRPAGETFILGSTGDALQGLGAMEQDIYMQGDKMNAILEKHPEMSIAQIKRIPEILDDPVLILKSRGAGTKSKNTRMVLFGTVRAENGQPVLSVLDLRPTENGLAVEDMQKVNSAYTKDGAAQFVSRSDVMYADEKRTIPLLRSLGLTVASRGLLRHGSVGSIAYGGSGVKLEGTPFADVVDAGTGGALPVNSRFSVDEDVEERKKERRETKPIAESRAIIAKRELRQNLIGTFSIPAGMKAEIGAYIDSMADRLIKNGALSQSDMSELFDRMYSSGVMELAADEMHQAARGDIAGRRIYVPERVKSEFGDDWAEFRKSAFSAGVWLTNSPGDNGIDTMNAELAAELPGIFDAGETDERIMLERIVQAAEDGKAERLSLAEYTALLAGREYVSEDDILDNMERQMDWALRTFAEKARLELKLRDRTGVKIAQEREKARSAAERQRTATNERIDRIVRQERERGWENMKREKAREIDRRAKETAHRRDMARQRWEKSELREMQRRANETARRRDMARRQRENRELREMQQKTLKQLQWLSKNRLKAPEELRAAFDDVLGDIDILAVGAANAMQWSNKYGATWGDLAQMYKDAQENDPNFLPSKELQSIVDRLNKTKLGNMDIDALTDLYKAAVGLRTEYYNRNNVLGSEMHELFSEVYSDSRSELHFGAAGKAGEAARKGKKLGKFFDEQLSPMNIMQRMTGWNKNSTFYGMAKQLEKGERDMRAYTVKATRMLQNFLTENADWARRADGQGKDGIWYEIEVPELLELGMGDKPIFGDTVKVYMTPTQKVHMYLESKGYDNLRHMAGGRTFADRALYSEGKRREAFAQGRTVKLAPETVKLLVSDLTPEEAGLAQVLESYYNSFAKDEINRVSNILYGFDKAVGQNYAPIYTNSNYNKTEFGKFDTTAEGVGNLKARQYSKNPSYNIGAFDAFERHIDQTARFVGMAIPARNWETLLNWREGSSSMSDAISHEWGDAGLGYIKDLVTELQSGRTSKGESVSTLADTLLSNYIGAVFGANPSIVMKQLGSIPLASAWLGMGNIPNPAQVKSIDRGLIAKYTQELDWRTLGYSMPETKTLKENPNWTQRNKFTQFTFGGGAITAMDGWAASVLWPWAENKVRREHPELSVGTRESIDAGESEFYKRVAEEFNEAVARSQSTSDEMHQGTLRKSKNPLARVFTMFKSDSSQTYNALRQMAGEAAYYKRVGDKEELRRANRRLGSAIIAAIGGYAWAETVEFLMNLWKRGGKKYRDDEGELTAESAAKQMVLGLVGDLAGIVTGGEELADAIGAAVTGGKWYELGTPGLEQLNDITNLIVGAVEGSFDVFSDAADIVRNGGDLAEYLRRHGGDIAGGIKELAAAAATYIPGISANNLEAYLLGTVRTVSPELAAAYEDMFQTAVKSRLDGLTGDALAERIGSVLSVRRVEAGEETAEQLAALYEAGYKEAVPADTPEKMSVNGEERKLSPYQQQTYDTVWSSTIGSALDELVGSSEFEQAGDEERAGMVKALYDYAADAAKQALFDDYESKGGADIESSRWAAWKGAESALEPESGKADVSNAQRYALLQSMDYTDEEKAAIAGDIMGTEMTTPSGEPSAYAKMLEALDTGLGMDDYLELRIAGAVDRYLDEAAAGANVQTAKDAAIALAALKPAEGKTQVSDAQRWRAALDAAQTGEEEMNALKAVMDERQFAKLGIARDYGIDPELFVSLKEVLPQFDEDESGRIDNAELEAAIDAMGGGLLPAVGRLTQAQQAALWQIYTTSTDPSKNPFGPGVGRKVQKVKEAAMEEIKAREKEEKGK